jgi:hypothetical protein
MLSRNLAHRPQTYRFLSETKRQASATAYPSHLSRLQVYDLRWVTFLVASAGTHCNVKSNTLCNSKRKRRYPRLPPPVGINISSREFSSSSTATSTATARTDNDLPTSYSDDCPLCAKYSIGPCGTLFRHWLACTDAATAAATATASASMSTKGGDENRDAHVALCAQDFDRFQACLEEHPDYYDTIHLDDEAVVDVNPEDIDIDSAANANTTPASNSIHQAWETMIQEELSLAAHEPFPDNLQPIVRIRPKTRTATASYISGDNFVLAFCRNDNEDSSDAHTLLAAGGKQDLHVDDNEGRDRIVLAFRVPADSTGVIVSAVYERIDDTVVVYEHRVSIAVDAD